MDSILTSIKKLLGIDASCTEFDTDVIIHINTAFSVLNQIGIGPYEGFVIQDNNDLWSDYIGEDTKLLEAVKTYVYLKVRLVFDPPSSTAVLESMKRLSDEYEWRFSVIADSEG